MPRWESSWSPTLAARDQLAALPAWTAFAAVTSEFNDFGDFYVGLFLLTAGWAIVSRKALSVLLGWISLIGGVTTLERLLGLDTCSVSLDARPRISGGQCDLSAAGSERSRSWVLHGHDNP